MAGFMSQTCALRVFAIPDLGAVSDDQVRKFAFSQTQELSDSDALEGAVRQGWVGLGEADDVGFTTPITVDGRFMAFSLRTDSKKANGKAVKLRLAERIRQEGQAVSRERKKELKEIVTLAELKNASWTPSLTDCILDLDAKRLYVSTVSDSACEAVLTFFSQTFGAGAEEILAGDIHGRFEEAWRRSVTLDDDTSVYADGCHVELFGEGTGADGEVANSRVRVENNNQAVEAGLADGLKIGIIALEAATSEETDGDCVGQSFKFTMTGALTFPKVYLPKPEKGEGDSKEMELEATLILHASTLAAVADIGIRFAGA